MLSLFDPLSSKLSPKSPRKSSLKEHFKIRLKTVFLTALVLFVWVESNAQSPVQVGFHTSIGLPIGEFKARSGVNAAVGAGGYFLVPVSPNRLRERNLGLAIGLNAGYLIYGHERIDYQGSLFGNFRRDEEIITNQILQGHLLIRLGTEKQSRFSPYVDALLGANHLYTRTAWRVNRERVDAFTEMGSWTSSFGVGAGARMRLVPWVNADLRLLYLKGGVGRYLIKGSIQPDPNNIDAVLYDIKRSNTDLLMLQIGLNFMI
jgi:opacity protein-like surface antigen